MNSNTLAISCLMCVAAAAQTRVPAPAEPTLTTLPANLPAQAIGANDLLMISVYDAPELSRSARVGTDGLIRIPMLKQQINVQGLLPADVETKIGEALIKEGILLSPVVSVGVAEYHSRPISVAGAVRAPITFQCAGPMTLCCKRSQKPGASKRRRVLKSWSLAARKRCTSR